MGWRSKKKTNNNNQKTQTRCFQRLFRCSFSANPLSRASSGVQHKLQHAFQTCFQQGRKNAKHFPRLHWLSRFPPSSSTLNPYSRMNREWVEFAISHNLWSAIHTRGNKLWHFQSYYGWASAPPLLALCSISAPQVSNFDSLTTVISILESSVADIQFLCRENKGWRCSWTTGSSFFQTAEIWPWQGCMELLGFFLARQEVVCWTVHWLFFLYSSYISSKVM